MKTFQDILKEQLEIPAQVFGKDPLTGEKVVVKTISPIEAMVKSVMNNAMKGDIPSIAFIQNMTKTQDPERERQAREEREALVITIAAKLTNQLVAEGAYDGQDLEITQLADTALLVDELSAQMASPDFQAVTSDPRTGREAVSPVIALRDKQREQFQQQLDKLRTDALRRKINKRLKK